VKTQCAVAVLRYRVEEPGVFVALLSVPVTMSVLCLFINWKMKYLCEM